MEMNVIAEEYLNWFPPGYRFCPTNDEFLINYLKNKVLNLPLPCNKILDVNIYSYSPRQLYDMNKEAGEEAMYFFTLRDVKYPKGKCPNRAADDGFWKANGVEQPVGEKNNRIGYKISLVFFRGAYNEAQKTNWLMYEFTLNCNRAFASSGNPRDIRLDDEVPLVQIRPELTNMPYTKAMYGGGSKMLGDNGQNMHLLGVRSVSGGQTRFSMPSLPNPGMKSCTSCQLGPCYSGDYGISMPTTVSHPQAMLCTSSQLMPQLNQDNMLPNTAALDTGDHISDGNTFSEYYNHHPVPNQ